MAAKKPVSQSKTMWVKKGTVVNGEKVKKGYLAQYGKPEKKVSGTVALVTGGQGAMGATKTYKQGRAVKAKAASSSAKPATGTSRGATGGTTAAARAEAARKRRLEQNKGVKAGTIRAGAAGKGVRKYNAKTGRWERVTQQGTGAAANQNQGQGRTTARTSATSGTVSSAMSKKTGSYTPGTGGGTQYQKALTMGRTRKYGADTPGNRALSAISSAVSERFSRSDAQVKAANQKVAEERRRREAAVRARIKAAKDKKK
jgi:hypothetical protein